MTQLAYPAPQSAYRGKPYSEVVPRQNRRRIDPAPEVRAAGGERRELWAGEDYAVRTVAGAAAGKAYRCPGCDQQIPPGRPHVVIWPVLDAAAEDRRHWHSGCWAARERRAPGVQRGRGAPRY